MEWAGGGRKTTDDYAIIEAVKAGCDVIIQNYDIVGSINAIEDAVKNNEISIQINSLSLKNA